MPPIGQIQPSLVPSQLTHQTVPEQGKLGRLADKVVNWFQSKTQPEAYMAKRFSEAELPPAVAGVGSEVRAAPGEHGLHDAQRRGDDEPAVVGGRQGSRPQPRPAGEPEPRAEPDNGPAVRRAGPARRSELRQPVHRCGRDLQSARRLEPVRPQGAPGRDPPGNPRRRSQRNKARQPGRSPAACKDKDRGLPGNQGTLLRGAGRRSRPAVRDVKALRSRCSRSPTGGPARRASHGWSIRTITRTRSSRSSRRCSTTRSSGTG